MRLAATHTHNMAEPATPIGGLLLRMRAWFAGGAATCSAAPGEPHDAARDEVVRDEVVWHQNPFASMQNGNPQTAILLPFPIRGEALLVRLAELLRQRVAGRTPWHNSFVLTMSRTPRSRLTIDHATYVEFDPRRATYCVVVEAAPDTTITVDTTDFDTAVKFVTQYVVDRLSDAATVEIAS